MAGDGLSFACLKHMVNDKQVKAKMDKLPAVQLEQYMPQILTAEYVKGDGVGECWLRPMNPVAIMMA